MADDKTVLGARSVDGVLPVVYEAPRVRAVGNLRDLLAGMGSMPCDSGAIATGPDPLVGPPGPDECGTG
jgi:hypothetical protein